MRSSPLAGTFAAVATAVLLMVTACGGRPSEGTIRVLAAASLTGAFTEMAEAFEVDGRGGDVEFNFAASSALARQVEAGAPADVVATADEITMRPLVDSGDVPDPRVLARNRLALLVEKGNPEDINGLADLARDDLVVVLCAPEVPCGRLARDALVGADVEVRPSSLEENVSAVTTKVLLGEADAGIVYITDARAAAARTDSVAIETGGDSRLEAVYSIGVIRGSSRLDSARAWVDFALSPQGQSILARHGFLPP